MKPSTANTTSPVVRMRRRNGAEHYHTRLTTPQPREMMPLACENTVDADLCHCLACAQAWACCPVPTFHSQTRELRWRDAMQQLTPVGACGNSVGGSSLSSFANPAGLPRINQMYAPSFLCVKMPRPNLKSCSLPRSRASGHTPSRQRLCRALTSDQRRTACQVESREIGRT